MRVTFYTKPDCGLCEPIHLELLDLKQAHGFSLLRVDVSQDPGLAARYGNAVPVVRVESSIPGGPVAEMAAPINQLELGRTIRYMAEEAARQFKHA
jgi:hypothetical protein